MNIKKISMLIVLLALMNIKTTRLNAMDLNLESQTNLLSVPNEIIDEIICRIFKSFDSSDNLNKILLAIKACTSTNKRFNILFDHRQTEILAIIRDMLAKNQNMKSQAQVLVQKAFLEKNDTKLRSLELIINFKIEREFIENRNSLGDWWCEERSRVVF